MIELFLKKGFTIAALVLAIYCLFAGVLQAGRFGMFTIPTMDMYSTERLSNSEAEESARTRQESANQSTKPSTSKSSSKSSNVDPDLKAFFR